jgi:CheY-like chemotaxis protein
LKTESSKSLESSPRRRVLVVDDNLINRTVAIKMLERLGCTVESVENGQQAVDAVEKTHFDAVFMDCRMPVMDGLEAVAEIRRLEGEKRHTIIIAVTAQALKGDRECCMEAGMDEYLTKPVRIAALEQVLDRFL